jgi:hypothetical protein
MGRTAHTAHGPHGHARPRVRLIGSIRFRCEVTSPIGRVLEYQPMLSCPIGCAVCVCHSPFGPQSTAIVCQTVVYTTEQRHAGHCQSPPLAVHSVPCSFGRVESIAAVVKQTLPDCTCAAIAQSVHRRSQDSTWRRAQALRLIRGTQDLTNIANEMPYKLLYGYYEPLVAVTRSYPASTQLEALDVRAPHTLY